MKKLLLLLVIASVGLGSCKKDTYITEPLNRTILVDIDPSKWVLSNNGVEYSTVINVPENNVNFNQSGAVVVAMSFEDAEVYEGLPHVYSGDSYTFASRPGSVTIFINDAYNAVRPTPPDGIVTAKVTLIDAEIID